MSLKAWYPLNGTTANYGSEDLDLVQVVAPTFVTGGKIGQMALNRGGFKWTAAQSASVLNNDALSYACWIMPTPTTPSSDRAMIFGNNAPRQFSLFQYQTANDLHISWYKNGDDTSGGTLSVVRAGVLPSNTWTHIAVTYSKADSGQVCIYVNGSLEWSTSGVLLTASSYSNETTVIHDSAFHRLNDVRIYDHCLSQKEIRELAKGLCLHYPMNSLNGLNCQPNMALTASMQKFNGTYNNSSKLTVTQSSVYDQGTESGYAIKETVTSTAEGAGVLYGGMYWTYAPQIGTLDTLVSGETYTFSVSLRASKPVKMAGGRNIVESQTMVSCTPPADSSGDIQLYTSYHRYSFTFKWTSTAKLTSCFYVRTSGTGDTVDVWIADPKLEKGSVATGYVPNVLDSQYHDFDSTEVPDESGMGNDSLTVGTLELSTDTPRYTTATKFTAGNYIYPVPDPISSATTAFSISVWIKTSTTADSTIWTGRATAGKGTAIFMLGTKIAFDDDARTSSKTAVNTGNWVHVVCTWAAGAKKRIYINGVLDAEATASASLTKSNTTGSIGQMSINGSISTAYPFNGMMSDFRIYATELSAADVSSLYRTSASMDNLGNLHTGEVAEIDGLGHQSMTRTGSARIHAITEFMKQYDSKIYVEPDGSMWVRAFHHYSPIGNAFSTTDPFVTGVYGNDTRWFAMGICNYIDKWEIIYEHQPTVGGAVSRFRWAQGTNPMSSDSTFDNTKNANITKYTAADGYSAISGSYGGMYRGSVSNAYLRVNNNASSNWFGAVGMCNTTWNDGQIPSYNGAGISTGYLDVYIRVDNVNLVGYPKAGFSMNRTDGSISTTGIIEL